MKYFLSFLILAHTFVLPTYANQFASLGFTSYALSNSEKCILDRVKAHLGVTGEKTYLGLFGLSGDSKWAVLNAYFGTDKAVTSCIIEFNSTSGWNWKYKDFHSVLETTTLDPNIDFSFGDKEGFTLDISSCF